MGKRSKHGGEIGVLADPAAILDWLVEGIQVIGFDYRYLYVNRSAAQHGRATPEALIGRTMMECYSGIEHSELFARLRSCLEQGVACTLENEFQYADGGRAQFELRVEPVPQGVCVLSIDISARKRAEAELRAVEERLRHSERLEAVGLLAAGIAHDFNNLLGVMIGYGERTLARSEGPSAQDVESMMAAARRSAELTRQLLAFGGRQILRTQTVDPIALVRDLETMLRRTIEADVQLSLHVHPPVGTIEVDPAKLEQVVMNLVLNARDALPDGGSIVITLAETELDEEYVRSHPGAQPGPHVLLAVSDDGIGMDAATQARIFEPFFTTKEQGKGTGLGLSTVYGIVNQSGGNIWVYSEPGQGTTFKLYFPRAGRRASSAPPLDAVLFPSGRQRRETVVVAEDDELLRALAEETLASAGYRVLTASSGDQALQLCRADDQVALLVTDVVMPGMRGPELILEARQARPELRVLCTSGYSRAELKGLESLPDLAFLEKPYLPSVLVRTVDALLAAPREDTSGERA